MTAKSVLKSSPIASTIDRCLPVVVAGTRCVISERVSHCKARKSMEQGRFGPVFIRGPPVELTVPNAA